MGEIHYSNYERHGVQRGYIVFYFIGMEPANYFEALLIKAGIEYERGQSANILKRHLFGVHQRDEKTAKELNDETGKHFQKPFLGTRKIANFIILFTLLACLLALAGYFLSH